MKPLAKRLRYRLRVAVGVAGLGAGPLMRLKIFCLCLSAPLRGRLIGPREACLGLRYGRLTVPWVVGTTSDFDVLYELLVLRIYERGMPAKPPKLVLDLGSHIGASVLFFREKFPHARIVALEPDPHTFKRLSRNVGQLPGIELRSAAIAGRSGRVSFFPAQQAWLSSLTGEGDPITVEALTLDDLIAELGPIDLLKIDIEGAERDVVATLTHFDRVDVVVGEYHDSGDPADRERFFGRLRDFKLTVNGEAGNFVARRGP